MMDNIIIPVIFGAVQGLTEFLPVSSSGHLVFFHALFPLDIGDDLAFDVALHLATLLAAILFFWKDIRSIVSAMLGSGASADRKIGWQIVLASLPAAFFGFFFEDIIENVLRSLWVVVLMLVVVGWLFLIVERRRRQVFESYKQMTWKQSFLIGCAQALALIPGTSRSGITIISGLWLGLRREEAIKFSFLLSIPIIFGANLTKMPAFFQAGLSLFDRTVVLAFISAFIFAYFSIKYLLAFARTHRLDVFAYYRIILALLILAKLFLE